MKKAYHSRLGLKIWGFYGVLAFSGIGVVISNFLAGSPVWLMPVLGSMVTLVAIGAAIYLSISVTQPMQHLAEKMEQHLSDPELHMEGASETAGVSGDEMAYLTTSLAALTMLAREKMHWYVPLGKRK